MSNELRLTQAMRTLDNLLQSHLSTIEMRNKVSHEFIFVSFYFIIIIFLIASFGEEMFFAKHLG